MFSWLVILDGWSCVGFPWARVAGLLVVHSGDSFSELERLFVFALGDCFLDAWRAGWLPGFWGAFAALSVSGCWLRVSCVCGSGLPWAWVLVGWLVPFVCGIVPVTMI